MGIIGFAYSDIIRSVANRSVSCTGKTAYLAAGAIDFAAKSIDFMAGAIDFVAKSIDFMAGKTGLQAR